ASKRGDVAFSSHALKAGGYYNASIVQKPANPLAVYVDYSGGGMSAFGRNAELRAGKRDCPHSQFIERHREDRRRDLLARRQQRIELAAVGRFARLPGKLNEIVSRIAHRRDHPDDRILLGRPGNNASNILDAGNGLD